MGRGQATAVKDQFSGVFGDRRGTKESDEEATVRRGNLTVPPEEALEHLDRIWRIAILKRGGIKGWSVPGSRKVAEEAAAHLQLEGIRAQVVSGSLRGSNHTWIELADGTIIDPTIERFFGVAADRRIGHTEIPWQRQDGDEEGAAVAVVPPNHPLHADYEC